MAHDPFLEFKTKQAEAWSFFAPTAIFTTPVAGELVEFADVRAGERVLDVGTGTGVVAITAARAGAKVSAIDLSAALIAEARSNAAIAVLPEIDWHVGDAEALPFEDRAFDVVLSQFGHIFAPRAEVAIAEMRRVLRPGGRVVFASWPPEHLVGQMFQFFGSRLPPPPPGASPPAQWGDVHVVRERLRPGFGMPTFRRGVMPFAAMSLPHYRAFLEQTIAPFRALVASLADQPKELARLRAEFDAMAAPWYGANIVHQDFLMTRAYAR